jgi:hypothetical protein
VRAVLRTVEAIVSLALVVLLHAYRLIVSPILVGLFGARCRFYPACSSYALEAVRVHGPWRGARLALARLARCHPYHPGGYDPVTPLKGDGDPPAPRSLHG